jgi:GTP cyclohydrolase I
MGSRERLDRKAVMPKPTSTITRVLRNETDLAAMPASERIRYRLVGADCRYHANDNIAAYVQPGELDELKAEVQAKMQDVLRALVIDTDSDHNTQGTAERVPDGSFSAFCC